eukprot:8213660-Pyramimonas_sp.AAC.1
MPPWERKSQRATENTAQPQEHRIDDNERQTAANSPRRRPSKKQVRLLWRNRPSKIKDALAAAGAAESKRNAMHNDRANASTAANNMQLQARRDAEAVSSNCVFC